MSTRELQQRLIENLREWQKLENAQIDLIEGAKEQPRNPVVALVMEIIARDSEAHRRMQQLLIDSLESRVVTIAPPDVDAVADRLIAHLELQEQTVRLAQDNLASLAGKKFLIQELLLEALRHDEEKHRGLLRALEVFRSPQAAAE